MFLCIFGNFPINRRKTIRNQKCVDLRKRAAAEKTAVRAQRARVRALQHQPRIRAFFHQRRLLLRLRAPENKRNRLRKLCQCGNHRVGERLPAKSLWAFAACARTERTVLRKNTPCCAQLVKSPLFAAGTPRSAFQFLIDILQRRRQFYQLTEKSQPFACPAHDTGPARESRRARARAGSARTPQKAAARADKPPAFIRRAEPLLGEHQYGF